MTFISYAQNFEDVMLWRALSKIENGFYIDAGAWSPDFDSVTRAFYEHGWHGINIEPNPLWYKILCEKRTKDINIPVAISDQPGVLNLHIVSDTGLSTANMSYAREHESGGQVTQVISCQADTLDNIWNQYVQNQEVQFLKVDVEGLEEETLRSNNWQRHRPWIVLVEATLPNTQTPAYQAWEPILLEAGYRFVYADGLNRFYVAKEHAELESAFSYPPNFFDQFKLFSHVQAESQLLATSNDLKSAQNDLKSAIEQIAALDNWLKDAHTELTIARQALLRLQNSRLYKVLRLLGLWKWFDSYLQNIKFQ